ncbi:RNA exonuclease 1 homolog isoform X2 [Prorops nasuta]|uniref:RNA exonuclease 1 homolog isoform X2 n=1 Tax=Prorops nasuta TaxID=863751 RepID=UPI0034CEC721
MLPSAGYFKVINCPFYENGSCERPYCHFKHLRRDAGGTASMAGVAEPQTMGQKQQSTTTASTSTTPNSQTLQQLVSEAVKKVLADEAVTDTDKFSENVVSQVVKGLNPNLTVIPTPKIEKPPVIGKHPNIPRAIMKPVTCVYNPTPISELKKRHIPIIAYMPARESKVAAKRKVSPECKPWLNTGLESEILQSKEVTYKPTTINPKEQNFKPSYVPTLKSDSSSSNSYEDSNSNDYIPKSKEVYYPKSKKKREEYVPKNIRTPLNTVQQLDEATLDQFKSEFDIIDEILIAAGNNNTMVPSEESEDYALPPEGTFSDDEPMPEVPEAEIKKKKFDEAVAEEIKINIINNKKSTYESSKNDFENKSNHNHKTMPKETKTVDKSNSKDEKYKSHDKDVNNKSKDRPKDANRLEKVKKDDKSNIDSSNSSSINNSSSKKDKDKKDHESIHSSNSNKDKYRHKSSSNDRHHSSSSKDSKSKDKDRNSQNSKATHKSRHISVKEKDKDSNKRKEKSEKHKSNKIEKERYKESRSKSKTEKYSSNHKKSDCSKTSHRSSSSSKKSSRHKSSSNERSSLDKELTSFSPLGSPVFNDSVILSDSDHDVEEECLKIFQEYEVLDHPKTTMVKESVREIEEPEDIGKKRVAHPSASTSTSRITPSLPPKKISNPQQKLYERWRMMKEAASEKAAEKAARQAIADKAAENIAEKPIERSSNIYQSFKSTHQSSIESSSSITNNVQMNGNGRIRIAHVPYAMSLALEKKKVAETISKLAGAKPVEKTAAQTSKRGRVAHIPQMVPQLIRPEPLAATTQKFPINVRQHYVNLMHDICVQIYTNGEDASERAIREEFACHERCKALPVYKNSCMLAAHRLRKEVDQGSSNEGLNAPVSGLTSHEAVLAGKSQGSWSVIKTKKAVMSFKGSALYSMLTKWIMNEQQLRDNGFPRPHPEGPKGRAKIYVINSRKQNRLSKVPNERICERCGESYFVDKYGFATQQQNCIYHWGRKFTIRGEGKYSCCQQYGSATGCCDAKTHVWEYTDYENLRGYVKTLPKDVPVEEQGVYSLDCEMSYTTQGLELTRVTVINEDCNVVYETLVKPLNPVIDYNTRFSGITKEDMQGVTTTLLEVQAALLSMFSSKTILVGHSLESDFKALRLLHDTVVDTSVMFPHRNGYPQKRALKNLSSEYLRKIIQNDIGGHDSKEDAVTCMELILWKVKEEAKLQ